MQIKAAVTPDIGKEFEIREVELAEPKANEVRIKVVASGVCHTDMAARDTGMTPLPAVLGHEGSGIIEKIGDGVEGFEVGDHVVMSYVHCGNCEQCLTGKQASCEHMMEMNFGGAAQDGTHRHSHEGEELSMFFGQSSFATHAICHQQNIVKVPKDVDLELLGPLGCGIQTGAGTVLNTFSPKFGESIAIFGAGGVGLSAVMAANIVGAKHIIAVDVHDNRLDLAKELGATHIINGKKAEDVAAEIKEVSKGGVHYALDTTGVSPVILQALHSLRAKGELAVVGVAGEFEFNLNDDLMTESKVIKGVIEGDAVPKVFIPQMIDYYKQGRFPFDKLVKMYDFEEINQAFHDSEEGTTIKPILRLKQ
jgi:aryl-alcohol dehydrogenase